MESKEKTELVVNKLETTFGIPEWKGRGKPLGSLIMTILSQSTSDHNRDLAYTALKKRFPRWELVMNASQKEIADTIRPAGLANQKSGRIKKILEWINEKYGALDIDCICVDDPGEITRIFTEQKGIGIKTISVVLMFACGADVFPVDTHVHRICKRLGLVHEKATAEKTHRQMQPLVPPGKSFSLHINLLKLGRTICKARNPACSKCPLLKTCEFAVKEAAENTVV